MSEHTHRVAVVVFCEVDCEGAEDAEVVAQQAIRRKVITDDLTFDGYGRTWPIRAVRVMEAGVAATIHDYENRALAAESALAARTSTATADTGLRERVEAAIRLISPDHLTPAGARQLRRALDDNEPTP